MRALDPGAFTARLTLERPVEVPDGQGGVLRDFETQAVLWARVEPVAAALREAAGAEQRTVTHRVWLRRYAGIAGGMRFRIGARILEIRTCRDPDETGRYLLCDCWEVRP